MDGTLIGNVNENQLKTAALERTQSSRSGCEKADFSSSLDYVFPHLFFRPNLCHINAVIDCGLSTGISVCQWLEVG